MNKVFKSDYSNLYDIFYQEKDYKKECNILKKIIGKYQNKKIKTILDIGCGTGNYTIPLSTKGYKMTGVDISEYMINLADKKTKDLKRDISYFKQDVRFLKLKEKFDTAIMMFAVLGYQIKNNDVLNTLKNVHSHLNKGGLFIFDVWYGPAVIINKPSNRIKTYKNPNGGKIIRIASGNLNELNQTCLVKYKILKLDNNQKYNEFEENHYMRYFFPKELELFLKMAGFDVLEISAFPNYYKIPTENDWNIIIVSRAF